MNHPFPSAAAPKLQGRYTPAGCRHVEGEVHLKQIRPEQLGLYAGESSLL